MREPQKNHESNAGDSSEPAMARIVERNIRALISRRLSEEQRKSWSDWVADTITRFTGSMTFVYIHLCVFGAWIFINLGWIPGIPKFDPTFVVLAMVASVEAIFLSTFVLISQNRMQAAADKRADLDLQISLLSEHEVTRLIIMVTEMAQKMGIDLSQDAELAELKRDIAPEKVLETIEHHERRSTEKGAPDEGTTGT